MTIHHLFVGLMTTILFFSFDVAAYAEKAKPAKKTKKASKKKPKRANKVWRSGYLFVSNQKLPTRAEDNNDLIRKGQKANQKSLRWEKGTNLSLYFLLVLRKPFGSNLLNIVLFEKGKKPHLDVQRLRVKKKLQRMLSPVSFSGSSLKKGAFYELRATRLVRRGTRVVEKVVAQTTFSLR